MEEIFNAYQFKPMILVFLLSFVLGSSVYLYQKKIDQENPILLLNLFCLLTCLLTYYFNAITYFQTIFLTSLSILLSIIVVSSICYIALCLIPKKGSVLTYFSFLLSGLLGMFLAVKAYSFAAILIAASLFVNSIWYLKRIFFLDQDKQTIHIQCLSQTALDNVYQLFKLFRINVINKSILKDKHINLKLTYKTSAVTQHILLKRLYSHDDIGAVIT